MGLQERPAVVGGGIMFKQDICAVLRNRDRSNCISSQKSQRTESIEYSHMTPDDFINIIKAERDKILIQIGKGTLDWIIQKEEAGNRAPFEAPSKSTYAGAAKSVTLVAKLDPEGDTAVFDEKSWIRYSKATTSGQRSNNSQRKTIRLV
ncbi:hypothetical protein DAPPUDRAFT_105621 [Daphnia pulex]|uniref:Uncharacterized protein n=1 Tax=Daphnia pulex TaxID=6669 RepID=E9GRA1_DAPPU|nr:hypothetical protein DAPPUDRAFT_105621 [Daphnia pulex]|eukprot:EFX78029.1 hypothetical protein DAPPUDRAFT_105621 [Daphnia pulex]